MNKAVYWLVEAGCVRKQLGIPVDVDHIKELHNGLIVNPKHTWNSEIRAHD